MGYNLRCNHYVASWSWTMESEWEKNHKNKPWFWWLLSMLLCFVGWLLVDLQIHTCPWEWDLRSFSIMADFQFLAGGLFFSMNQQLSITVQCVKWKPTSLAQTKCMYVCIHHRGVSGLSLCSPHARTVICTSTYMPLKANHKKQWFISPSAGL